MMSSVLKKADKLNLSLSLSLPRIMHMVCGLLYFVVVKNWFNLPISFRITSRALGQSGDCPSACEVTPKDMSHVNLSFESTMHW